MKSKGNIHASQADIEHFCRKYHIKKLALFGSALRGEFGPDSDIDILVEFKDEHIPGLIKLAGIEEELSRYFGGRKVDLRTPKDLSRYFRQEIIETAEVLHIES
ncbi:MAG: nucleotidyltransferase family protein [Bacillota bacterium]